MCGRFTIAAGPEFIGPYFDIEGEMPDFSPSYNIVPSSPVPVIRQHTVKGRCCELMHWGLIPHWAKEQSSKYKMINARAETLGEKPAYREAFQRRRCLIPASGFYEWHNDTSGKQPYYIHKKDGQPFAFAGLWDSWQGKETIQSFTIITTEANAAMSKIHHRMPVIIPDTHYTDWLNPLQTDTSEFEPLLHNHNIPELDIYAVSKTVNNPANNHADLIKPL